MILDTGTQYGNYFPVQMDKRLFPNYLESHHSAVTTIIDKWKPLKTDVNLPTIEHLNKFT